MEERDVFNILLFYHLNNVAIRVFYLVGLLGCLNYKDRSLALADDLILFSNLVEKLD